VAGTNLHLHPSVLVAGIFDEPVRLWDGVPQSYVVEEFLSFEKGIGGGFLLFSGGGQPIASAGMLPGLGAEHRRLMSSYERTAAVAIFLNDRTAGSVAADSRGRAVIEYRLNEADQRDVTGAIRAAAEILFAAGAKSVVLPYNDLVELKSRRDGGVIEERGVRANDPLFLSFHPQGTLRMGGDGRHAVVDAWGKAHGVEGLYVADASVFPTSVAVPPQVSVMAFASRTAEAILHATKG
jgi:choline dehydrogenase-like flavoprotein